MSGYPDPVEFIRNGEFHVWQAWSLDSPMLAQVSGVSGKRRVLGFKGEKNELLAIFPHAMMRDKHGFLVSV
jgi:hypothetical protein